MKACKGVVNCSNSPSRHLFFRIGYHYTLCQKENSQGKVMRFEDLKKERRVLKRLAIQRSVSDTHDLFAQIRAAELQFFFKSSWAQYRPSEELTG